MDPAAILGKYGWEKGKGLGKNEDGIKERLAVKKKQDTEGIGVDRNKWSDNWWDYAYNKVLKNLDVNPKDEDGDKSRSSSSSDEAPVMKAPAKKKRFMKGAKPSTMVPKHMSVDDRKKMLYGMFVQAKDRTLEDTKLEKDSDSDSSEDEADYRKKRQKYGSALTDEDLFRICGGRTAKRYDPRGKLARVQAQEKKFRDGDIDSRANPTGISRSQEDKSDSSSSDESEAVEKRKKREKKNKSDKKAKKKRKAKKRATSDDDDDDYSADEDAESDAESKAKAKKAKRKKKKDKKEKKGGKKKKKSDKILGKKRSRDDSDEETHKKKRRKKKDK